MVKQIAWVLGGGGSRGALQVGAIQALLESGIQPDLLVGTSIGAVNAAFLALHGINSQGLAGLVDAWHDAMHAELLPSNYLWLTLRTLFNRPVEAPIHRMRDFFISHGLAPDLKFGDIDHVPLIVVAADLNASCPVHYGMNPNDRVLDGLLASTALPPWIHPLQMEDRLLMDGGVISNLPIEPALTYGAKEIIALSLMDFRDVATGAQGFGPFVGKVFSIVQQRQVTLELALAEATGAKIHRIDLLGRDHIPLWDFEYTDELIARGYEIMQGKLAAGMLDSLIRKDGWLKRVKRVLRIGTRDKQKGKTNP